MKDFIKEKRLRFEIFRTKKLFKKERWYFRLVGANKEIMSTSEPYLTKSNALRAINVIKIGAFGAEIKEEIADEIKTL
jgi:uncharacterized protein YegP (UPF0339 family)